MSAELYYIISHLTIRLAILCFKTKSIKISSVSPAAALVSGSSDDKSSLFGTGVSPALSYTECKRNNLSDIVALTWKINSNNSPQSSLTYTLWGNPVKTALTIEQ